MDVKKLLQNMYTINETFNEYNKGGSKVAPAFIHFDTNKPIYEDINSLDDLDMYIFNEYNWNDAILSYIRNVIDVVYNHCSKHTLISENININITKTEYNTYGIFTVKDSTLDEEIPPLVCSFYKDRGRTEIFEYINTGLRMTFKDFIVLYETILKNKDLKYLLEKHGY